MKKFLVLGLGVFLVACGQSALTEEEENAPAVEVEQTVPPMEETALPEVAPATETAVPAVETPVTEEAAQ